jgi:hypothetical protein
VEGGERFLLDRTALHQKKKEMSTTLMIDSRFLNSHLKIII